MKQPVLIPISKRYAKLLEPYTFKIEHKGRYLIHTIYAGYCDYNGMSGGNFLLSLIGFSRFGWHNPATLIHDYCYVMEGKLGKVQISRLEADRTLKYNLRYLGYSKLQAQIVYIVVRLFGRFLRNF